MTTELIKQMQERCAVNGENEDTLLMCWAIEKLRAQEARITALTKVADPEPIGYMQKVIEALYENGDPVSIDAAELLERVSTVTTQWQLIETAPHGKVILGFIPHSMGGYVCPTLRIELGSWNNASCAAFSELNPTHWMPLPKPPIAAAVNAFNGVKP